MKQLLKLFFAFCLLLNFTSCAIYEDITFHADGKVEYKIRIDGKELLAAVPDLKTMSGSDDIAKNEVISLADKLRDSETEIDQEMEESLKAIEPIYVNYEEDFDNGKIEINIFGTFDDAAAFNKAVVALQKIQEKESESADSFDLTFGGGVLSWDGKKMKRTVAENSVAKDLDSNEKTDDFLKNMFSNGKMVVKYHFPKKISSIDNPKALLTQNQQTVVVEYSSDMFVNPNSDLDIEVDIE